MSTDWTHARGCGCKDRSAECPVYEEEFRAYVKRTVDGAPPFTQAQLDRIATLLSPFRAGRPRRESDE